MSIQVSTLPGGRLHLNHGPIDLICLAWGDVAAIHAAYKRAISRFETVLPELCAELPALRAEEQPLDGQIAQIMAAAAAPYRPTFITPMAAVAGSVADTILETLKGPGITRAYVNNGGDIAFHLSEGTEITSAIGTSPHRFTIRHDDPVRGIATSGWGGRSHSLGIADTVTVLAKTAAMADAAATMIANAVNLDHPAITRAPARALQADSDLGDRLVTVHVDPLTRAEVAQALNSGLAKAAEFRARGLIHSAALFLNSDARILGPLPLLEPIHA
jgi:ApbE superfamily uncharacterized protein (UPF0280 family)